MNSEKNVVNNEFNRMNNSEMEQDLEKDILSKNDIFELYIVLKTLFYILLLYSVVFLIAPLFNTVLILVLFLVSLLGVIYTSIMLRRYKDLIIKRIKEIEMKK